jgi:capsid protein
MTKTKKTLVTNTTPKTALRYTAIRKMAEANLLPRSYATEAAAVSQDAGKMLAVMRDMARNSEVMNSLIVYLTTLVLGCDGCELLIRDSRREEIDRLWRNWIINADATGRGSFFQIELFVLAELIVAGECLLVVNDDLSLSIVEAERVKAVEHDQRGRVVCFVVTNGDKETTVPAENALYVANYKRPSSLRGSPLFACCADSINILSAIVRSVGLSWSKVAKHALAVNLADGVNDLVAANSQTPDAENEREIQPPAVIETQEATMFVGNGSIAPINQSQIPGAGFGESVQSLIRLIASSSGINGDCMMGNMAAFSFSAARYSANQTAATVRRIQSTLVQGFYRKLVARLLSAWGYEGVSFDVVMPLVNLDDAERQAATSEKLLNLGLSTFEDELLSQNKSRAEHLAQLKRETLDAIRVSEEIRTETGVVVPYQHFCGRGIGKMESAALAVAPTENL